MKVIVAKDYADQCSRAADIVEKIVRDDPTCCLGLATGSSPVGMYQELARRCREEGLDFSKVHSVNLDEYIGLEPTHDQSYRYFMDTNLFNHIDLDPARVHIPSGKAPLLPCRCPGMRAAEASASASAGVMRSPGKTMHTPGG